MKILLDTHTFLWASTAPEKLSKAADNLIHDRTSAVLVSIVVPWELAIKSNSGKLQAAKLLVDFEQRVLRLGFSIQGIQTAEAIRSGLLPFHHRDPFDRLLAAQSLEMNVPLISRDAIFDRYGVQRIW